MGDRRLVRALALLACLVVFVGGGVAVYRGLQDDPPAPTPTPEVEFSISLDEALETDRAVADEPIQIPEGAEDWPYVNTDPVTVPSPDPGGEGGTSGSGSGGGGAPGDADPANHLYVPSIYVSAPVVPQGVTSSNEMSLPGDLRQVGLLDTTAPLGAPEGSTLIAGHVTQQGYHGALYFLGRLRPGASVTTVDAGGEHTDWVVTSVRNYRKTSLPAEIFATTGPRMLTLVTCGGPIIRTGDGRWTHTDNIVVIARPVP